jgi:ABC-2 type transport system ATP-binding protein
VTAVVVHELRKSYGAVDAVAGISFAVEQGEVFGLLGPNGAGKTTTVEILEGYRKRVLQSSELPAALTVREVHRMFAGYFAHPRDVDEVIGLVGLEEKADARVKTLSGGQKRRLDLGVALVGDPELVFLDEPTTGFDPAARRTAWELVRALRALGKTILLTTHYLDEAQQLADRVAVLREGRIVKIGSPAELIGVSPQVEIRYREDGRDVVIATAEPTRVLAELTGAAVAAGRELAALEVVRPSLEDVYLDLIDNGEGAA